MGLVTADDGVWAAITAAQVMVNFADCWSPGTEEISKVMGDGGGGPFALGEGSAKWYAAASKLQEAQQGLTEMTSSLPRDYWNGDDRAAFDTEVSNLAAEIGDAHNYAMAVAITLTTLTVPLGLWPVMCDTIGVVEAALATAFYAAAASVVGDVFGVAEELFADGEVATEAFVGVVNAAAAVLIGLMAAGTAAIVISDAADIDAQEGHGDTGIGAEFGKAVVDSSAEVAMTFTLDAIGHAGGKEGGEEGEGGEPGGERGEGGEPGEEGGTPSDEGGEDAGTEPDYPGEGEEPGSEGGNPSDEGGGDEGGGDEGGGDEGGHHEEDPISEVVKERLKDKGRDKIAEPITGGLSQLINAGASTVDHGWNSPDAPKPSDEQWGAGEE